jgi:carbon-monoxide dehydrogenase large subunit
VGGHATLKAAERVDEKAGEVAAAMLEAAAADVVHEDGYYYVRGNPGGLRMSWQDVAYEAHFLKGGPRFEPGLEATAFYDPPDVNFAFGANAAVVEVDIDTGKVTILDFYSVDDAGVVLNPSIVRGQIHGGIAQGVGQALLEEIIHDRAGQVLTANFATYRLPTALDVPEISTDMICTPSDTPLGVRGVGESGTLASPAAIVNAVNDALSPFGVVFNRTPLSPSAIWEAIHPDL